MYARFLYFRYFIALEKPLIICEGKTDVAYLKIAIKQLKNRNNYHLQHQIDFFISQIELAKLCISILVQIH